MRRTLTIGSRLALLLLAASALPHCSAPPGPSSIEVAPAESVSPVLLVGIDGATFDLILPLAAAGKLPRLAGLMQAGAWGRLGTISPTVSPAIWTTIATGKPPETHGILGFDGVPGQSMTTLPTTQMRKTRAFWNILSEHGRSVGTIGWWVTWPAEPVNGYVVSDRAAYTRMEATLEDEEVKPHEVYPEAIAEEIRRLVRRPEELDAGQIRRFMPLDDDEIERLVLGAEYHHGDFLPEFKYVYQSDRSTADIALALLSARPTDVTAVAFYGVDTVSHLSWHFMQPEHFPNIRISEEGQETFGSLIENYYVFLDGVLGELIDAAPSDATVIVFSDHGFGPTGNLPWSGGHDRITPGAPQEPDGVLILSGPPIRRGVQLNGAHVLDVTPTLLRLQGFPAADDMSGRVLREAFVQEFTTAVPERRIPTYEIGPIAAPEEYVADPEVDSEILERLRGLGYVE